MNLYLCCGNKSGVERPEEWVGVDINGGDITADVRALKPADFPGLARIFATPPCNGFTDLPWRPATNEGLDVLLATKKFCEESGVPYLLECSRFAQKHIGETMHAKDCVINNAADDPEAWWKAAYSLARLNAPIPGGAFVEPTCPECGANDRLNREEWQRRHILRTRWLKVSRAKGSPTKAQVREICEWMERWGQRPDNFWLHFAGLADDPFGNQGEPQ